MVVILFLMLLLLLLLIARWQLGSRGNRRIDKPSAWTWTTTHARSHVDAKFSHFSFGTCV